MSRSRKKTPIMGHSGCESEKPDKVIWHRKFRRAMTLSILDAEREIHPHYRQHSDVWGMGKDGKSWFGHRPWREKEMRK